MNVENTKLPGVLLITPPTIFEDFRGSYVEIYNEELYNSAGINVKFIQDDVSMSSRHVLRGIHGDMCTYKLISCLEGRFYMIVVNNDPDSPQYRQWESFTLSEKNNRQVLVPPKHGIGHLILSERAIFHYKQSSNYDRRSQFTILWNDPKYKIWWPVEKPSLSQRDSGNDA